MNVELPQQRQLFDRTGQLLTIRPASPDDAPKLLQLKKQYIQGSDTIPLLVTEYNNTPEQEREVIKQINSDSNSLLLLAEQDGKLIGNIDLIGSGRSKTGHTARLGIGLLLESRNKGIGSILMNEVIKWAKNHSELRLIWLDTYSTNMVGLTLYNKVGFKPAGVIPGFFNHNGQWHSKVQMYLKLEKSEV